MLDHILIVTDPCNSITYTLVCSQNICIPCYYNLWQLPHDCIVLHGTICPSVHGTKRTWIMNTLYMIHFHHPYIWFDSSCIGYKKVHTWPAAHGEMLLWVLLAWRWVVCHSSWTTEMPSDHIHKQVKLLYEKESGLLKLDTIASAQIILIHE